MAGRAIRQSLRCARSVALAVHDLVAFGSLSVCAFEPSRRTGPSCGSDGAACPASHPRTDVGPTGVQRFADSAGSSSSLSSVWPDRRRTPPRRRPQRLPNRTAWDLPDDDRRAGSGDRSSPACPSLRRPTLTRLPRPGDCRGGTQLVLKGAGAVAGDRVEVGREPAARAPSARSRRSARPLRRVGRVHQSTVTAARAVARMSAWRTGPTYRLSHPRGSLC